MNVQAYERKKCCHKFSLVTPCIMYVQYPGGCAVQWGMFGTPGDIMNAVGDIMSTLGMFSTLGDIMSTPGDIMINVGEGHWESS